MDWLRSRGEAGAGAGLEGPQRRRVATPLWSVARATLTVKLAAHIKASRGFRKNRCHFSQQRPGFLSGQLFSPARLKHTGAAQPQG